MRSDFFSISCVIADLFRAGCQLLSAPNNRVALTRRFVEWRELAGFAMGP